MDLLGTGKSNPESYNYESNHSQNKTKAGRIYSYQPAA